MEKAEILVVNGDRIQLRHLVRLLERQRHRVTSFQSPSRALEHLLDAGTSSLDLIIVDLHMPGIDGWKFCRLLRSNELPLDDDTPVLVLSSTFSKADAEAISTDLGANGFLSSPFSPDELEAHVQEILSGRSPRRTESVLIVEDDPAVQKVVADAFRDSGFDVTEVRTGREGLSRMESTHYDVVIADYHLPDISGRSLLSSLRVRSMTTVAIAITGDEDPHLALELLQAGADAYVRKPFSARALLDLTAQVRRERALLAVEEVLETRTQELRQSEERYRSLFEAIPAAVIIVDRHGRILHANPSAEGQLRTRLPYLVGTYLPGFVSEEGRSDFTRALARIWVEGAGETSVTFDRDGEDPVDLELVARTERFHGQPSLLIVSRDVTARNRAEAERRLLEAQVRHSQKLESLGVLAGGIAHDFNNLLLGVLGNANLARSELEPGTAAWESLHQIELAARRAADLTSQILSYSGRGDMKPQEVNLSELMREMGELLDPAVSKKAILGYELEEDLPSIHGDRSQLQQIAMNLIMNASDALEGAEGHIYIRSGRIVLDRDELEALYFPPDLRPGPYCYLEVEDTGCGMTQDVLERIFDPFFTTKTTGRGLGMAATQGIIQSHGGGVSIRTAPGDGTTFRIVFPQPDTDVPIHGEADDWQNAEDIRSGSGEVVLVIDDEVGVRELVKTILEGAGYEVLLARNGRGGIGTFRAERDRIAAVVVDLTMPQMDGEEFLQEVRQEDPALPVIISSGFVDDDTLGRLQEKGVTTFLHKPYDPSELIKVVGHSIETMV